jgi:hypothetical protein
MTSKQQYLNDRGKSWHPHLMFFVAGDAAKSWGADLPGSPVLAANDPQERATIFLVLVGNWPMERRLHRICTERRMAFCRSDKYLQQPVSLARSMSAIALISTIEAPGWLFLRMWYSRRYEIPGMLGFMLFSSNSFLYSRNDRPADYCCWCNAIFNSGASL